MSGSRPPPHSGGTIEGDERLEGSPVDEETEQVDADPPRRARRPSEPPRRSWRPRAAEPADTDEPTEGRHRLETLFRESFRKALEKGVEAGLGTLTRADSKFREVVDDVKLPREIAGYVFSQIDETKNALVRVVAREIREFLDATDLSQELQRALTSLSFEIKTEIRFVPNDAGGVKPVVRSKTSSKTDGTKDETAEHERDGE